MKLRIFMLIACGFMGGCENWPSGYVLSKYTLKKCMNIEIPISKEMANEKLTAKIIKSEFNNKCNIRFDLSRSSTRRGYAVVYISKNGCGFQVATFVTRLGCNKNLQNYDQKLCDEYMVTAEKYRDDFIDLLSDNLKFEIDNKKIESTVVEEIKDYRFSCE